MIHNTAPFVVMAGKEAKIRVAAQNIGYGPANHLSIETAHPRIIQSISESPLAQILELPGPDVDFTLTGSSSTPDETEYLLGNLNIDFGAVAPQKTVAGYWTLLVSRNGFFIDINSTFKHLDYQGIALDPLILPPTTALVPAIGGTVTSAGQALPGLTFNLLQGQTTVASDKTDGSGVGDVRFFVGNLALGSRRYQQRIGHPGA